MKKIPFVRQHDSMECGVACLSMLCAYFGRMYSISFLGNYCKPTKSGVSVLGISQAAANLGLQSECFLLNKTELSSVSTPCILHWNQNHFVVLSEIRHHKYYILDPGKGLLSFSEADFLQHWIADKANDSGIALFFNPTKDFGSIHETGSQKKSFLFLWDYIQQYRFAFSQIILSLVLVCVFQLLIPFLTQSIVDIGIKQKDISVIMLILLGEFMIIAGKTGSEFIRTRLLLHISMRINISLLSDFFIKLLKLPMNYFDTRLMGDLIQRMNDHNRIQTFLTSQSLSIFLSLISLIVFGIVLLTYNLYIFSIFLTAGILYGFWTIMFLRKRRILDYEIFEVQSVNQNKTIQLIGYVQEIKLQNCENIRRWEWEDAQADIYDIQFKVLKLQQIQQAGALFLNELKNMCITAMTAYYVIKGQMSLGTMLAVQYIIGQLNSPIENIMSFIYSLQDVRISLERINEIHMVADEDSETKISPIPIKNGDIIFNNVNFKYDIHNSEYTIRNLSLRIPAGKITAIVGASGSGKTTLVKLMLGFYPALSGEILLCGRTINSYNMKEWRSMCGTVMQDGIIFSETIARNIAVREENMDFERITAAAQLACIHDDIMKLPHKYKTKIGRDGIGLSQGQKQRILIARAIYKNPDYIFLDEATNALDAKNERTIIENLNNFYKGRTVVVVAHRLSTVKNADQIVVLDAGRIVEIGNHHSLIGEKGLYYNLVKNQLNLGN